MRQKDGEYSFPCHLLPIDKASHLKHLRLTSCTLRLSSEFTSRLNSLRTLDLDSVPLYQSGMESILSGCSKLACLRLLDCSLPENVCIHGQLLCLKSLIICDSNINVELNSMNIEFFEFRGRPRAFTFVDVPHLRKVEVWAVNLYTRSSPICNALAVDLPQLQFLTLLVNHEVRPLLSGRAKFNSLKELDLSILVWKDSDLLTTTYLLNASPLLEILRLKLCPSCQSRGQRERKEYSRHTYSRLKEIEIKGFYDRWTEMELLIYLLKNSISLERMIVGVSGHTKLMDRRQRVSHLLQKEKINLTTELIIL